MAAAKRRNKHRTKRNSAPITSPEARDKLKPSGKPYFHLITAGLHLGYRKNHHSQGAWVARRAIGDGEYTSKTIGKADDFGAPEGGLPHERAVTLAREWFRGADNRPTTITVGEAVRAYSAIRMARHEARSDLKTHNRMGATMIRVIGRTTPIHRSVPPHRIAGIEVGRLTQADLHAWRQDVVAEGKLQPDTVKRISSDLSAALNSAVREHKITTLSRYDIEEGLKGNALAEVRTKKRRAAQVLSQAEVKAVIEAARERDAEKGLGGDLHRFVLMMALTGARESQVRNIRVGNVVKREQGDGVINVPVSHKGFRRKQKRTHNAMPIDESSLALLAPAINGRASADFLLERNHPTTGVRSHWNEGELGHGHWPVILRKAGLHADYVPMCLRHSGICWWLTQDIASQGVAVMHDTSIKMIADTYGTDIDKLLDSVVGEKARGRFATATVVPLRSVA